MNWASRKLSTIVLIFTSLHFKGRYVMETYKEDDVTVYVGGMVCMSLMQKGDNLTCLVPDNDQGDEIYDVRVSC